MTSLPPASPAVDFDPTRRSLAIGLALFPGILLHGTGHYVLGKPDTGTRLLLLEVTGLGLIGLGGGVLVGTGAAKDFVAPGALAVIAGAGTFLVSWAADVYGVIRTERDAPQPLVRTPRFEAALGHRYVYAPNFAYRHFVVSELTTRFGAWRLSPELWSATNQSHQQARLEAAHRFLGPSPDGAAESGNFLDLVAATTRADYVREGFAINTWEGALHGRYDLRDCDARLEAAFVEFSAGAATQLFNYATTSSESTSLLLARFEFGLTVADPARAGGTWRVYYDHRHDGFAGGLLTGTLGSGVTGHFGLGGTHAFNESWGLQFQAEVGSAALLGLSGRYRFGQPEVRKRAPLLGAEAGPHSRLLRPSPASEEVR